MPGFLAVLTVIAASFHVPTAHAATPPTPQSVDPALFHQGLERASIAYKRHDYATALQYLYQAWRNTWRIDDRERVGNGVAFIQERQHNYAGAQATLSGILPLTLCPPPSQDDTRQAYVRIARLAWLAGEPRQTYALLRQAYGTHPVRSWGWGGLDRDHWHLSSDRAGLTYDLAGMTFPATTAGFLRGTYASADDSHDMASVDYVPLRADNPFASGKVTIAISTRQGHAETVAHDLRQWLAIAAGIPLAKEKADLEIRPTQAPTIQPVTEPRGKQPAEAAHTASGTIEAADSDGVAHEYGMWISRQGVWQIEVHADWPAKNRDAAQHAIAGLMAAILWKPGQAAYHGTGDAALELDKQFDLAMLRKQWPTAAELARKRTGSAVFPHRRARLYSAIAIAAMFERHYPDAMNAMHKAMHYWHYTSLDHDDEGFYDTLLLDAANIAFHLGDNAQGITWLTAREQDQLDPKWTMDKTSGSLRHNPTGVVLPARLGSFLRIWHEGNKARYQRIQPSQYLGITLLDKIPGHSNGATPSEAHGKPPDAYPDAGTNPSNANDVQAIETSLRTWMTRGLGLTVGAMRQAAYPPAGVGHAHGIQFLFDVTRTDNDGTPHQRTMGFWVSTLQGRAIVLRSGWARGDARGEQAAATAAAAFAWPQTLRAVAGKQRFLDLQCKAPAMAKAFLPGMQP
ncbi:MAG TPA: hypothetical protein VFR20_07535 [Burkholderiaceae bacterium]|nr:hypothetical protein [Burkholderiaceae bacterium]